LIKRLNPNCVLLNNSKLPERGLGCNDDSIIKGWMWKPQAQLNPAYVLFDHYSIAQEAGRAYALNVGPDTTGHNRAATTTVPRGDDVQIFDRPGTSAWNVKSNCFWPCSSQLVEQIFRS
jgi:hypothetical protein